MTPTSSWSGATRCVQSYLLLQTLFAIEVQKADFISKSIEARHSNWQSSRYNQHVCHLCRGQAAVQ